MTINKKNLGLETMTESSLDNFYDYVCEKNNYWADRAEAEGLTEEIETEWTKASKYIEAIEEEYKRRGLI